MSIVDRFLSKLSPMPRQTYLTDRKQYQLLSMAALYIAIKVNEPEAFGSDSFAALSFGVYTQDDIENMEVTILNGLEYRIYAPTGIQMAYHILSLISPRVSLKESTWCFILDEVRFQAEYAVRDYYFSTKRPSTVALAAIFNTLDQVDRGVRQDVLSVLIEIMDDDKFAPVKELFEAKRRLKGLVERDGPVEEDEEDVTCADEPSRELEDGGASPRSVRMSLR